MKNEYQAFTLAESPQKPQLPRHICYLSQDELHDLVMDTAPNTATRAKVWKQMMFRNIGGSHVPVHVHFIFKFQRFCYWTEDGSKYHPRSHGAIYQELLDHHLSARYQLKSVMQVWCKPIQFPSFAHAGR